MNNKLKVKEILPPVIYKFIKNKFVKNRFGWFGDYPDWQSALKECSGYDDPRILKNILDAALQVKQGKAKFERDGVLFIEPQYNYPLLSSLLYCSNTSNQKLHVLDYGGSLGSVYFQHKEFLNNLEEISWNIVEQEHFVTAGKEYFQDDILKFFSNIKDVGEKINVILLSSVLQYIEKPFELLEMLLSMNTNYLIIDRTPFYENSKDMIKIQKSKYHEIATSYPCWIFEFNNFCKQFPEMNIISIFDSCIQPAAIISHQKIKWKGFLMKNNNIISNKY